MKNLILAFVTLISASAFADSVICGSIHVVTGFSGTQIIQLSTSAATYVIDGSPTGDPKIQNKLAALKTSGQSEDICVTTAYPILDNTVIATGFTKFEILY